MRMRLRTCLFPALLAVTLDAAAQCAGFLDVSDGSQFCANLQWLRNRSITMGCTASNLYCPGDAVARLTMAAFMNRLGIALTPTVLRADNSLGGFDLDNSRTTGAGNVCQTAPFTVTGYPRRAVVNGHWTGLPAGTAMVATFLTVSADFAAFFDLAPYGMRDTGNGTWIQTAQSYSLDLAVGSTYVFAIGVERAIEDFGTVDVGAMRCTLVVTVHNRNGAGVPFDEIDVPDPATTPTRLPDNRRH